MIRTIHSGPWRRLWALGALLAAAPAGVSARAQEPRPEPLAVESAAILPLEGERRLTVEDIQGVLYLRSGKEGEIRFLSLDAESKEQTPLAIYLEDRGFRVRPPEGDPRPRVVEMSAPADLDVRLALSDVRVEVGGLAGDLEIEGEGLDLRVAGHRGDLSLELRGGRGLVEGLGGDATLNLRDTELEVRGAAGFVTATLVGGKLELERAGGEVDVDADGADVVAREVEGKLRLQALGGRAALQGLRRGAEMRLEGTPLVLRECEGDQDIETDAEVRFEDCEASLHINSWGAGVRGDGNRGLVEVKTDGSPVVLQRIAGPARVQGDGLEVVLKEIGGELMVFAASSKVRIEKVSAPVHVENDFGDVQIREVSGPVGVESQDGSVTLEHVNGPVQVKADGREVLVAWASLNVQEDSLIVNESGDVTLRLPRQGGCRIDARSRFGRVETDLETVIVSDSGDRAQGIINRRRRPVVRVEAAGSIYLEAPP